jgi:hypothetical protein
VTTQPDPRVEVAKHDPTLDHMIKKDIPITRECWIKLNWLADPPQPWASSTRWKCRSLCGIPARSKHNDGAQTSTAQWLHTVGLVLGMWAL